MHRALRNEAVVMVRKLSKKNKLGRDTETRTPYPLHPFTQRIHLRLPVHDSL